MPTPAARRAPSTLRRNLFLCTFEGICAMPLVYLNNFAGNAVLTVLLTSVFTLSESRFGLISALPAICNVIQMVILGFLSTRWSPKAITLSFAWLNFVAWIAFGIALPWFPFDDHARAFALLFAICSVISLGTAVMSVSWTSWVQEWLPERIRGKYFGLRNRLLQVSTVVFLLAVGAILPAFTSTDGRILAFQLIVFAAVAIRTGSILGLHRILSSEAVRHSESRRDWIDQLRVLSRNQPLWRMFAFGAMWGLVTTIFGPFFNVFLLDVARMPANEVVWLNVVSTLTGALSLPAWGRLLDRFGNRPVMVVALVCWMLPSFAWYFVEPGRTRFLFFLWAAGGIFGAGFLLGQFGLLLKLVPVEAKTLAVSLNAAITALCAAIGPIVGGTLLEFAWELGWEKLPTYQWGSVIHHSLALCTLFLLMRVPEPRSGALSQVVGAMRSSRQIAALLGLSFFLTYFFYKPAPRRPAAPPTPRP